MIDLRQFPGDAILNRHANRIGRTGVNLDPAHTGKISVNPLVEGMQSRATGTAAVKAVDGSGFRVQFRDRNPVVLWYTLKPPVRFAPNSEVIVIDRLFRQQLFGGLGRLYGHFNSQICQNFAFCKARIVFRKAAFFISL